MKKTILFIALSSLLSLTACGNDDLKNQLEKDAAVSKKTAGSVVSIPRTIMTPDDKKSNKEGSK